MDTSALLPTSHTSTCDTGTAGAGSATQPVSGETHTPTPFQKSTYLFISGAGSMVRVGAVSGHGGWARDSGFTGLLAPMLACPPRRWRWPGVWLCSSAAPVGTGSVTGVRRGNPSPAGKERGVRGLTSAGLSSSHRSCTVCRGTKEKKGQIETSKIFKT